MQWQFKNDHTYGKKIETLLFIESLDSTVSSENIFTYYRACRYLEPGFPFLQALEPPFGQLKCLNWGGVGDYHLEPFGIFFGICSADLDDALAFVEIV